MSVRILINGISNSGKTSLLKTLKDAFVISYDGKPFPLEIPHTNVEFETVNQLLDAVDSKLQTYEEKFKKKPKTICFDSVSRIFQNIADNCNKKYTGFEIWKNVDKEMKLFIDAVNDIQNAGYNEVLIAHTTYNEDTKKYVETCKGSFAKLGGFISVVDYAINIDIVGSKRIITLRNTNLARTLIDEVPDKQDVSEFNLQNYIDLINKKTEAVASKYSL